MGFKSCRKLPGLCWALALAIGVLGFVTFKILSKRLALFIFRVEVPKLQRQRKKFMGRLFGEVLLRTPEVRSVGAR